jgi:hypothetical protein
MKFILGVRHRNPLLSLALLSCQRFELFHRMIRFVFGNKNYVGPVEKVLSPDRDMGRERLRVLDLGTGGGHW